MQKVISSSFLRFHLVTSSTEQSVRFNWNEDALLFDRWSDSVMIVQVSKCK